VYGANGCFRVDIFYVISMGLVSDRSDRCNVSTEEFGCSLFTFWCGKDLGISWDFQDFPMLKISPPSATIYKKVAPKVDMLAFVES